MFLKDRELGEISIAGDGAEIDNAGSDGLGFSHSSVCSVLRI
jgi:hypothetical protein